MKRIEELLNIKESAWLMINQWLSEGKVHYQILGTTKKQAEDTLIKLQVTTKSTLGAIAYNTGGILFDNGWFRLLGAANNIAFIDLISCNEMNGASGKRTINGDLIVAFDVLGGTFAINGGAFEGETGNVFYFAPDTFEWEDLELGYTDFIHWLTLGKLNEFYNSLRWQRWQDDVMRINIDQGFSFYPPLWSNEGSVDTSDRCIVPIKELVRF
jgi:hypothetical protein